MTLPVVERIAKVIERRIHASVKPLAAVYRPVKSGKIKPVDRMVVLLQGVPIRNDEFSSGGAARIIAWDQIFALVLYLRPGDNETVPIETRINQFAAEVDQAISSETDWHLMKENSASPSGLATNARWESPDPFPDEDEAFDGIQLNLSVTFKIAEGDPFTPKS